MSLFTEDEAIAAMAHESIRWPWQFWTVDTSDTREVQRAIVRGTAALVAHASGSGSDIWRSFAEDLATVTRPALAVGFQPSEGDDPTLPVLLAKPNDAGQHAVLLCGPDALMRFETATTGGVQEMVIKLVDAQLANTSAGRVGRLAILDPNRPNIHLMASRDSLTDNLGEPLEIEEVGKFAARALAQVEASI